MQNNIYYGLYRAETPLMHGADEKMETTTLCRYNMQILKDGSSIKIYNLSTSTWRHTIRENAALRLLSLLDLKFEDIPELVQIVLVSGGPRLEKGEIVPLAFVRELRKWFPLLDMMGTTVPFCMFEGKMYPTAINVLTKILANNYCYIEDMIIKEFSVDIDSLSDIVTEFQFNTKRDPRTKEVKNVNDTEYGTVANMFDTQMIIKGALLGHQVVIRDYDNGLLSSCLNSALEEWKRNGSYIGGKKSQGCGNVSFEYKPALSDPNIYESFIIKNKDVLKSMVMDDKVWKDKNAIFDKVKKKSIDFFDAVDDLNESK